MTNAQWRQLTYILAVVFLVLLALVAVLALTRPSAPAADVSPSATASAALSTPTESPSEASPSVAPSDSASPSASPSGTPGVPSARAAIRGLGLDDPTSSGAKPRVFVFRSEGPGDVTIRLQRAIGGRAEFCLIPGTVKKPVGEVACLRATGSTLTGHARGTKPFTWTVTVEAVRNGTTPAVDLRIDWPVLAPNLRIRNVRLEGTEAAPNNGVTVDIAARPAAGELTFVADWNPPNGVLEQAYDASITDPVTGSVLDQADGTGGSVELSANLAAGQRAVVEIMNPEASVTVDVLAELILSWP